jgi:hypothetical protein
MAEIHRVGRAGADVFVVTPHFSSHNSYTDPTHVRHLAGRSFQYFTGEDFATFTGSNVRFSIEELEVTFGKNFLLDGIGGWLARRKPGVVRTSRRMDFSGTGHSLPNESAEITRQPMLSSVKVTIRVSRPD